ncbi:hypothetical protein OK349_10800 [Sphingomonas sp. BT-65]|uniref:hypothetical protein n=1 Tax=Sphingomonas sp. BT-65 TaxID=2989821 RepID=UPI002235BC49|nr:hypothetical protein [Sphingomonas sp. BT-65]MCW4462195.1 hypothetical protein [Sphingomonas sp. BT-65]
MARRPRSFRSAFRAFQAIRGERIDAGFAADLDYLQNRDLDLSVRLGAMLAFNALMITIGTHPISASPGAPLSLDAARQPVLTLLCCASLVPLIVSSFLCLRAMLLGEEVDGEGLDDSDALRQRLFAAFIRSMDVQARLLRHAVRWTLAGGAAGLLLWIAILVRKVLG